jgi:hypothetical protein
MAVALSALSGGVATAYFGTPIAVYFIDPPPQVRESVSGIAGLVFGVTGFMLLAGIHRAVKKIAEEVPAILPDIVKRWLERKTGG